MDGGDTGAGRQLHERSAVASRVWIILRSLALVGTCCETVRLPPPELLVAKQSQGHGRGETGACRHLQEHSLLAIEGHAPDSNTPPRLFLKI